MTTVWTAGSICVDGMFHDLTMRYYNKLTKGEIVMASHELYTKMGVLWNEFSENHSKFTDKGNKAAATRARKAVGELKKLVTEYRKASVAESKRS